MSNKESNFIMVAGLLSTFCCFKHFKQASINMFYAREETMLLVVVLVKGIVRRMQGMHRYWLLDLDLLSYSLVQLHETNVMCITVQEVSLVVCLSDDAVTPTTQPHGEVESSRGQEASRTKKASRTKNARSFLVYSGNCDLPLASKKQREARASKRAPESISCMRRTW